MKRAVILVLASIAVAGTLTAGDHVPLTEREGLDLVGLDRLLVDAREKRRAADEAEARYFSASAALRSDVLARLGAAPTARLELDPGVAGEGTWGFWRVK